MAARIANRRRRATVLLMVVSMLALLIVIVTSFLSVTQAARDTAEVVTEGAIPEAVLESSDAMFASFMADAIRDGDGKVLGGGPANNSTYETIPGYRQNHFLAALEPIWDEGLNYFTLVSPAQTNLPVADDWQMLAKMRWPSVTALEAPKVGAGPHAPLSYALCELMPEDADDLDARIDADPALGQVSDPVAYSLNPFMDADGDGFPDAAFLLNALTTQTANAAAGVGMSLPAYDRTAGAVNFSPSRIPRPGPANNNLPNGAGFHDELWDRVQRDARYFVAHRVVAHGGMIALDAPAVRVGNAYYPPLQRGFVSALFDATKSRFDNASLSGLAPATANELYAQLRAEREAIEASLRRRFMLPSPLFPADADASDLTRYRRVPQVLSILQGEMTAPGYPSFPRTLVPTFSSSLTAPPANGQRLNLAGPTDINGNPRRGWAQAAAKRPLDVYGLSPAADSYDRRHLLTTVSTSDELARKLSETKPSADPTKAAQPPVLATNQGESKFYLGEVTKAFDTLAPGVYQYNPQRGNLIIGRLARLFGDMLSEHDGGAGSGGWESLAMTATSGKEAVSEREQAFMLAVNTVAFAAPRDAFGTLNAGWVDPVVYTDTRGDADPANDVTYTGYAPQPFITEVQVHNDPDPFFDGSEYTWDPLKAQQIAVAIELFNPQDPYIVGAADQQALNEDQFGIRIEEGASGGDGNPVADMPVVPLTTFAAKGPFAGRQFRTYVVRAATANTFFNSVPDAAFYDLSDEFDESQTTLTVKLLREQKPVGSGLWHVVDQYQITLPAYDGTESGFNSDSLPSKFVASARDTGPMPEFAGDFNGDGAIDPTLGEGWARWGASTDLTMDVSIGGAGLSGTLGNQGYIAAGTGLPVDPDVTAATPFGPKSPLITMNAAPKNDLKLFEVNQANVNNLDNRPRSFPTPGFMLFVPRFAHSKLGAGAADSSWPMSRVLGRQWRNHSYTIQSPLNALRPGYPADFGHMPIFDNKLDVKNTSYLGRVGKIPWGLLVFDYVTTLNPQAPGVDPLEVSGRIDINTAPWTVLANLPLIGPNSNGLMPLNNAVGTEPAPSAGFWDPLVGVMVGTGYDPVLGVNFERFMGDAATGGQGQGKDMPWTNENSVAPRWRLGPWLAHSAVAYRDGQQVLPYIAAQDFAAYSDAHLRGGAGTIASSAGSPVSAFGAYRPSWYSSVRGTPTTTATTPDEHGFVSIGELVNVKGFDSTMPANLPGGSGVIGTTLERGDFVQAVSLLALLDTQWLTTRSNTFTVYTSIMDREEPQRSLRSQTTFDRGNLLPRLAYTTYNADNDGNVNNDPLIPLARFDGTKWQVDLTENDGESPRVISHRVTSYLNDRAE